MISKQQIIRDAMIDELCEVGDLIRKGDDIFEDMGGHLLHESNLDPYISQYIDALPASEYKELKKRIDLQCPM